MTSSYTYIWFSLCVYCLFNIRLIEIVLFISSSTNENENKKKKKEFIYIIQQSGWEKEKEFVYSFELETDVKRVWGGDIRPSRLPLWYIRNDFMRQRIESSSSSSSSSHWIYLYVSSLLWNSRLVAFYLHNIWKRTGQQQTRGPPRPCWQSITSQLDCIVNGANLSIVILNYCSGTGNWLSCSFWCCIVSIHAVH